MSLNDTMIRRMFADRQQSGLVDRALDKFRDVRGNYDGGVILAALFLTWYVAYVVIRLVWC